jgi:hypothetical protein
MSAITNTPTNRNMLSPLNFKMVIQRTPTVNFFLQTISIPGLSFEGSTMYMNNPFPKVPLPGDHLNYSPLKVSFMVDEDLNNYLEIFNWIVDIAGPSNIYPERADGLYKPDNTLSTDPTKRIRSDIKLMVLSSSKNPNIEVTFIDAFPSQISELNFATTENSVNYLQATVTFDYVYYTIKRV